ncbi:hypothetical protein Tco_0977441 [Tanacetum coccineum]|uniref:Uncharacterized protein n=1 Tax=Tanacetum coccineum TaxID=301880 RepID=A0ABQ5EKC5_9ASTR
MRMTSQSTLTPLRSYSTIHMSRFFTEALDSFDGPPLQDPYVATIARWRSRVTARPSSSHEFPIAPVTALPGIRRRSATLIRPGEAIPFGRPYRTHLNGPRKLLTARKRVGPLPARRLASRHASPRSPDHHSSSSSSSSDSSPVVILVFGCARSGSSGEAFRRWCAAPLSTLYPPTTSESSSGDSSERPMHLSSHSAGPSRKRCRSLVDSAPLSMPVTGSLAPTRADLSPPRKRFRDSYSSEASIEEDAEVGLTRTGVDMELGIGDGDELWRSSWDNHRDARVTHEDYEGNASAGDMLRDGIVRERVSSIVLHMSFFTEEFVRIVVDRDDARGELRRLESYLGGFRLSSISLVLHSESCMINRTNGKV